MIADDEIRETEAFVLNEDSKVPAPTVSNVQDVAVMFGAVKDAKNEVAGAKGAHRTVIREPEYDTPNGDTDTTSGEKSKTVTGEETASCMLVIAGAISDAIHWKSLEGLLLPPNDGTIDE